MSKPIYLYVAPFFPSEKHWRGGFFFDAVKALKADGRYEVVVMTSAKWLGEYEICGIKVYYFPRLHIRSSEYFEGLLAPYNNRLFISKLKAMEIRPEDIAVCHVHDYEHYVQYALEVKRWNPKCLTLVHHHFAGFYDLSIGRLGLVPIWSDLLYLKMRREFESVDAHVFISEHCKRCYGMRVGFDSGENLGRLANQLPWGRIYRSIRLPDSYVWYNGVDGQVFFEKARVRDSGRLTVGCVGNFNPCKCQMDLIRAFESVVKELPSAVLKLVGDGKTYGECVDYVYKHNLGENVKFLDPVEHNSLADFYRSIDLLVTPSVNEGFCCVNAEANYCGTPVVAIKGMPIEEILSEEDRKKWLVAPHDIEGLAQKIIDFANNPQKQRLTVNLDSNILAKRFVEWTMEARSRLTK